VAIPDDVDAPGVVNASGLVELPRRVRWSGPPRRYDLTDRNDRARVYEQVLNEGTDEDVRLDVVIDDLVALWPRSRVAASRSAGVGEVACGAARRHCGVLTSLQERAARMWPGCRSPMDLLSPVARPRRARGRPCHA
jgi:hypothetical protein